ncbi:hypothetical protein [Altericista sp. CCNU0014]|uniref:hypothetical protein n=1 Tax=Altericista sp. CCNU0014 TaxID=3082949 RepID=UPI00384CBA43
MSVESHPLDKYIDDFANLPELIIKEDYKDIIFSPDEQLFGSNEQQLIDRFHLRNQIVAFRLKLAIDVDKGFSVGNSNRSIEFLRLFKSEEKFYEYLDSNYIKSLSHLTWMDYQLIKEIWSIYDSKDFNLPLQLSKQIKSIGHWWWLIQCEDTRNGMKQVGLLGESPKIIGKREYTNFNSKYIDEIDSRNDDFNIDMILDRSIKDDIKDISASEALEIICFNLLDREHGVRTSHFEDCYQQWVEAKKGVNSAIQKEKNVKGLYLIDDKILTLEKYYKIPKKYKRFICSIPHSADPKGQKIIKTKQ